MQIHKIMKILKMPEYQKYKLKNQISLIKMAVFGVFLILSIKIKAQNSKDYYFKTIANEKQQEYKTALENINKALEINPENKNFLIKRGQIKIKLSEYNSAIGDLKMAASNNYPDAYYLISQCYSFMNNPDSSIIFLEKYLKNYNKKDKSDILLDSAFVNIKNTLLWDQLWSENHYSPPEILLQEAKYNFKYDKLILALEKTNKIIKKYENFDKAYFLKAQILHSGKNYKQAVRFYKKAIKINPREYQYYNLRAESYIELKKYDNAIEDLNKSIELNDLQIEPYYKLALAYEKDEKYKKAVDAISFYTKFFNYDNQAIFKTAQINYKAENFLTCIRIVNNLLEKQPNNPKYLNLRAKAYLNANSYQLAYNDFSMCLDLNPDLTEVYYYRGIANLKMQKMNAACSDWEKAIENGHYKANEFYYKYCNKYDQKNK